MNKGLILQSISGFYDVENELGDVIRLKAKGSFRNAEIMPKVGDRVEYSEKGFIERIEPRKNELVRPVVSNIDNLIIVVSTVDPIPNFLQIDELIAAAEKQGIEPIIAVSKTDIKAGGEIIDIYRKAGFNAFNTDDEIESIKSVIAGKINAFAGNTGAGKSTLLNKLDSSIDAQTGETSKKLGRGKHTTRVATLYKLPFGGYIADTPGFTTALTERYVPVYKDDLAECFREFSEYGGKCKFVGCSHTGEKGCAIYDAVSSGLIPKSRYTSYTEIYNRIKDIKRWQMQ